MLESSIDMRVRPSSLWITLFRITQLTGKSEQEVQAQLDLYEIDGERRYANNGWHGEHYPLWVVELINDEPLEIPKAGTWMTVTKGATVVRRTRRWVERRLKNTPYEWRRDKGNRIHKHYPPQVFRELKQKAKLEKPAGKWLTCAAIASKVNASETWTKSKLEELQVPCEERRGRSNRMGPHYPPDSVALLRKIRRDIPLAGGWYSMEGLERFVSKHQAWIEPRLTQINAQSEERRCSGGVVPHYPPEVAAYLKELAASLLDADSWLTVAGLAKRVGKSRDWVKVRIRRFNLKGENRLDACNREALHYPPSVADQLMALLP